VRPDGSESQTFYMFAPRADSELAPGPAIIQGRWLLPEDDNAVIIDTIFLEDEPDVELGDEIVLKIEGRERTFRVVGVSLGYVIPIIYGHYPYIARITGRVGEADAVLVTIEGHEQMSEVETATALEARFDRASLRVSMSGGLAQERSEAEATFGSIISLLLIMAILLAIVGGLGLMGTMSINVLERTREIGVLRAIGAPNRGVARVFIREGIAIGLLSWLLGSLFALPLSKLLSDGLGQLMANAPLTFAYSLTGVWLWLVLVVILSALASALPARNASRLTVREVLAYE
jgi:putative ABC transport system permease protein